MPNNTIKTTSLKQQAVDGFATFLTNWDFTDFWRRANTFDAIVHFVSSARDKWTDQDPDVKKLMTGLSTMITGNITFFKAHKADHNWADDYGWWGLASTSAHDYCKAIGDSSNAASLLTVAKDSWEIMTSRGYAPSPPDGCRNCYKIDNDNAQTKNTVTNTNLLLLSVRLFNLTSDVKYLNMAHAQYNWFDKYINATASASIPTSSAPYPYLQIISEKTGLITERPFPTSGYNAYDHPIWEAGWAWTGDQGLFLGCMAALGEIATQIYPNAADQASFKSDLDNYIETIINGTKKLFFDTDNILHEPPFHSSFDSSYGIDYLSGKGVFLRFLAQMDQSYQDFTDCINDTAAAVWATRKAGNQFHDTWNTSNQSTYNTNFAKLWHYPTDKATTWSLPTGSDKLKMVAAVKQAAGLDALGAAISIAT